MNPEPIAPRTYPLTEYAIIMTVTGSPYAWSAVIRCPREDCPGEALDGQTPPEHGYLIDRMALHEADHETS